MKTAFRSLACSLALIAAFLALPMVSAAQYPAPIGGAQPVTNPNYSLPGQVFTAASQTGANAPLGGYSFGTIEFIAPATRSLAVTNPTPTASTNVAGSVATFTLVAAGDTISGTLSVSMGGGTACVVTIPSATTLAAAVTLLNANTCVATTNSIVASTSTNTLVLTGPVGASGVSNLVVSPSVLTDTTASWTATWAIQGSNDGGVNWFSLSTAVITTPGSTATSQTSTANTLYGVNLAGMTNYRFATTSGTFNPSTVTLKLTATGNKGVL